MEIPERPLDPAYRIVELAGSDEVTPEHVLEFWAREGAVEGEDALKRVHQVLLVATTAASGEIVGVSTALLRRSKRLDMDLWYFRAYVSADHRLGNVGVGLLDSARELLERRFVTGQDARGAGVLIEVQNEGVQRAQPHGMWPQTRFAFVGTTQRGDHVRVRYFPGALAPMPTGDALDQR